MRRDTPSRLHSSLNPLVRAQEHRLQRALMRNELIKYMLLAPARDNQRSISVDGHVVQSDQLGHICFHTCFGAKIRGGKKIFTRAFNTRGDRNTLMENLGRRKKNPFAAVMEYDQYQIGG
jgi:hypothetical protein